MSQLNLISLWFEVSCQFPDLIRKMELGCLAKSSSQFCNNNQQAQFYKHVTRTNKAHLITRMQQPELFLQLTVKSSYIFIYMQSCHHPPPLPLLPVCLPQMQWDTSVNRTMSSPRISNSYETHLKQVLKSWTMSSPVSHSQPLSLSLKTKNKNLTLLQSSC